MFPIIWVWAPYGGVEGYPWYGRNYNLALEPWSGLPGNLLKAIENGNGVKIKPGQKIRTELYAFVFSED